MCVCVFNGKSGNFSFSPIEAYIRVWGTVSNTTHTYMYACLCVCEYSNM